MPRWRSCYRRYLAAELLHRRMSEWEAAKLPLIWKGLEKTAFLERRARIFLAPVQKKPILKRMGVKKEIPERIGGLPEKRKRKGQIRRIKEGGIETDE